MSHTRVFDTGIGCVELDLSDPATALIRCRGEIDCFIRPALDLYLLDAFALPARQIRVDLREVCYLGSDVYSSLQAANARAQSEGRDFALIVPVAGRFDFHHRAHWRSSFRPPMQLEHREPAPA